MVDADKLTWLDIDSCQRRAYGHAMQGVGFCHAKVGGRQVRLHRLDPLNADPLDHVRRAADEPVGAVDSPDIRVRPPAAPRGPEAPAGVPTDRFALWAVQTALQAIDPLVVPDGRFTRWFGHRVAMIRSARGLGTGTDVTADRGWNQPDVQVGFWADPWAERGPTEAGLTERIGGMVTPRPCGPAATAITGPAVSPCSSALPAPPAKVEVCVHHRGLAPAAGLTVLLLRRTLPGDPAIWLAQPTLGALPGLGAAMTASSAGGAGALPMLPTGWLPADLANPVRTPPAR